jgi:ApaG protein
MSYPPLELPGLSVALDKLVYRHDTAKLPADRPHAFIYYLTIRNASDRAVTLLGRKWIIDNFDGTQEILEGDKIVGETPHLAPGQEFSYNSYHITGVGARVHGSFHGVDDRQRRIFTRIPSFLLQIPKPDN